MKSSDDLFRLIKSLSKSEKRYFKLSVSKYSAAEDTNYLVLFDAIDNQEEYDEVKVKKKFSKGKAAKNFPTEKNHLYRMILKSLRNYSTANTVENKLKDMVREAEFLYDKALYDQCEKILSKAKELSIVHEKHSILLEIYTREAMLLLVTEEEKELQEHLTTGFDQAREMFRKAENVYEYLVNHLKSFSISKTVGDDFRNPEVKKRFLEIIKSPLYKDEKMALSFEAKHYFYFLNAVYGRMSNDSKKNYEFSKKDFELHEKNPEIAMENQHQYVSSISNYSLSQLENGYFDGCLQTLQKLKNFPAKSESIRLKISSIYYPRVLAILQWSGDFQKMDDYIDDVSRFLEKNTGLFNKSKEMNFYWNVAYCYFGLEKYKDAIHWLNRLLNDNSMTSVRPEMACHSKIFNLIIHYELGNTDLLEYLIRSTRRYFSKNNSALEEDFLILNFIEEIIGKNGKEEVDQAFKKIKKDYHQLQKSKLDESGFEFFDFDCWIESKLTKKTFQELVKEKSKTYTSLI